MTALGAARILSDTPPPGEDADDDHDPDRKTDDKPKYCVVGTRPIRHDGYDKVNRTRQAQCGRPTSAHALGRAVFNGRGL